MPKLILVLAPKVQVANMKDYRGVLSKRSCELGCDHDDVPRCCLAPSAPWGSKSCHRQDPRGAGDSCSCPSSEVREAGLDPRLRGEGASGRNHNIVTQVCRGSRKQGSVLSPGAARLFAAWGQSPSDWRSALMNPPNASPCLNEPVAPSHPPDACATLALLTRSAVVRCSAGSEKALRTTTLKSQGRRGGDMERKLHSCCVRYHRFA